MRQGLLRDWWESFSPLAKVLLIALAAPLLVVNAWAVFTISDYFHSLMVILVGASLLAFLLNYPVSFLERQGTKRGRAAVVVFLLALSGLLGLGVTLVPIAFQQAQQLVARLPEWIDSGRHQLTILDQRMEASGLPFSLDAFEAQINDRLKLQLQILSGEVLNVAVLTVTSLLDLLLTLVLSFYLLQHGDHLWHSLVEWLPAKIRAPFSQTLRLSFQNFFLGQLILGTCMGATLTLTFLWLAVPFGLLFGLTIGTMALVPFGGSVGIALVTLLVALRDIGLGLKVLGACIVVQQILENFVAPRVLGSVTGLNPVWVFVSILCGARIGGLLGVVVAVPTAVVIKSALVAVRSRSTTDAPSSLPSEDAHRAAAATVPEPRFSGVETTSVRRTSELPTQEV
ncbi:AI-2E family transporter [Leptolyngbya sp. FACHB-36]|uniref:AI-2E family transporter n=1 Tax=Leptolyngbya sp. FACHB-36 TaxID=2692808 RepID=UPI001680F686|nr:AI-2E family transporter [Leptolyngbya sp. FACHB-36]MBD2022328.1 AI-2E family transporter [Leptolyngbya sp. FACHB-36]